MKTKTQAGNLTISHYMTLLQKLTSIINYELMKICFKLAPNYNFVLDPQHKKKTNVQKEYKEYLTRDMGSNQTQATRYLILNAYRIVNKDIIDIFAHINAVAGDKVITSKYVNVMGKLILYFRQ
jgi:hypothetical protein